MLPAIRRVRESRARDMLSPEEEAPTRGKLSREEDEVLVERVVRDGDDLAFAELYDRYGGLVYSTGLRLLGDRSLAEELTQEVFASVWRKSEGFDARKASFSTWIFRIARNRATDFDRRRRARPRSAGDESLGHMPARDSSANVADRLAVAEALAGLSVEHRRVITLSYFRGLTQSEISHLTDTPLGTVKSRTTAALRELKKRMSEAEDE